MGLSTCSMTSLAVTKSKEARPSAEAKSFWSKSSGAWGAWASYHSEVRSTARKSLPKDWSGRAMAPGPHRSSAARMPDHAYLASTRSATNPEAPCWPSYAFEAERGLQSWRKPRKCLYQISTPIEIKNTLLVAGEAGECCTN